MSSSSTTATFTLDGLDYTPVKLRNFFTGTVVAEVLEKKFDSTTVNTFRFGTFI